MTGVAPLVLLALIATVSALFVLGGHVMRRTAGTLPVKRALLAGLPAELLVLYAAIPTVHALSGALCTPFPPTTDYTHPINALSLSSPSQVSNTIFVAFNCRGYQEDSAAGTERSFLLDDLSVQCWSSEHDAIRRTAIIFACVWPIGGTFVFMLLLLASRKAIVERTPTALSL